MNRSLTSLLVLLALLIAAAPRAEAQLGVFQEVSVPTVPVTVDLGTGRYSNERRFVVRNGQQGLLLDFKANRVSRLQVRYRSVIAGVAGVWSARSDLHDGGPVASYNWAALPFGGPGLYDVEIDVEGVFATGRYLFKVVVVPQAQRAFRSVESNTYNPRTRLIGTIEHTILVWGGPAGTTVLDKPILVVEGIDASNVNGPEAYYALGANSGAPLFPRGQSLGADIAILDFGDGGRRMQDNAAVVRQAIALLRSYRTDPHRGLDVIGVSMGGVVARYALAQMEQDRALFGVDRFLSVDAPQQGAVFQRAVQDRIFAELQPSDWPDGLARPAGRQLLVYNAFDPAPSDHAAFYNELRSLNGGLGYPTLTTNVGVSFGTPDLNPGSLLPPYLDVTPNSRWGRLDLDHLFPFLNDGWNYYVQDEPGAPDVSSPGSYLPRDVTQIAGSTSMAISYTGIAYPVTYAFERFEDADPTFIPYASALDLVNSVSRFDAPIIALQAGDEPSFHDVVPTDLVSPMLRRLGYDLTAPASVTISGPTELTPGETGRWRASTPDPTAGYQYNWEYQIILPGSTCSGGGGGVVIMSGLPTGEQAPTGAPPSGGGGDDPGDGGDDPGLIGQCAWYGGTSSSAIFTYAVSSSLWLEVRVRASGWGGSRLSAVRRVCVGACDGGLLKAGEAEAVETAIRGVRPNPFRIGGEAMVEYTLAEAGPVSLVVFDVLGREVARLVDGAGEAGTHTVSFAAASLPAGAYVVRLESGGNVATRTVTLAGSGR